MKNNMKLLRTFIILVLFPLLLQGIIPNRVISQKKNTFFYIENVISTQDGDIILPYLVSTTKGSKAVPLVSKTLSIESEKMFEGFESTTFPPAGWTSYSVCGPKVWNRSTSSPRSGAAAGHINWENPYGEDWLITPVINNIEASDSVIFFLRANLSNYSDSTTVFLSTTGNDTGDFRTVLGLYTGYPYNTPNYQKISIPLGAYSGQNVYIAIRHTNANGGGIFIDDFYVGGPDPNDIRALDFVYPANNGIIPPSTAFSPTAHFKNIGTETQNNVLVKYEITNNVPVVVYSDTTYIPAINTYQTLLVTFAEVTGGLTTGDYGIKIKVETPDMNPANDSLTGALKIKNSLMGIKTIGGLSPDYTTFNDAVDDLILKGVGTGGVTFHVREGNYGVDAGTEIDQKIIIPPIDNVSAGNPIIFQKDPAAHNPVNIVSDSLFAVALSGCDYVTFDSINIEQKTGGHNLGFGYYITNASETDGAWFNTIKNFSVRLTDSTSGNQPTGVLIVKSYSAVVSSGANSYNKILNFRIYGQWGIKVSGTSTTYPDIDNEIGTDGLETSLIEASAVTNYNAGIMIGYQENINIHDVEISAYYNGAASLYGIYAPLANVSATIHNCHIHNLVHKGATTGNARAITVFGSGDYRIDNNRIHDLYHYGTGTNYIVGLSVEGGTNITAFNNMISDIKMPGGTASGGSSCNIQGIRTSGGTNVKLYNNTVYLDALNMSASRNSGCLVITAGVTSSDYRNNIFVNLSQNGSGTAARQTAVHKTSTTYTNIAGTTDYNILYSGAGPFAGKRALFFDGTNTDSTIAQYQGHLTSREFNAVSGHVEFANTAAAPYDLHVYAGNTIPNNNAMALPGIVDNDYDGQLRDASVPDRGADEYTPSLPLSFNLSLPANLATNIPVNGNLIWEMSAFATAYDVYLDVVDPPVTIVSADQTDTTYTYSALAYSDTFYWKVIAKNPAGNTASNDAAYSFITEAATNDPPSASNLTEPADGYLIIASSVSADSLDFTWTASVDPETQPVTYHVVFSGNLAGTAHPMISPAITDTTVKVPYNVLYEYVVDSLGVITGDTTDVFWQVISSDGVHEVNSAETWLLRVLYVNVGPSVFHLLEPADNTIVAVDGTYTDTLTCIWSAATDPESSPVTYTFRASLDISFADCLVLPSANSGADSSADILYSVIDQWLAGQGIADGDTVNIYWKVVATDGVNEVNSAEIFVLTAIRQIVCGSDEGDRPLSYELYANYPNPFNPNTTIKYDLKENAKVTLKIFNSIGQEVGILVNTQQSSGNHSVIWDGKNNQGQRVTSGVYFYRLQAGDFVKTRKMVLLK